MKVQITDQIYTTLNHARNLKFQFLISFIIFQLLPKSRKNELERVTRAAQANTESKFSK
jgi:hypothetical protein